MLQTVGETDVLNLQLSTGVGHGRFTGAQVR
jgi:hypothetical protein